MNTQSNFPKFRAWHIERKTMHEVTEINLPNQWLKVEDYFYRSGDPYMDWVSAQAFTLMQSTGLKDKNDVEIFEGDIVIWNDGGGETKLNPEKGWIRKSVVHTKPDLHFILTDDTPSGTPGYQFHYGNFIYTDTENHLKILGNIHANPELLKGAEE